MRIGLQSEENKRGGSTMCWSMLEAKQKQWRDCECEDGGSDKYESLSFSNRLIQD